VVFIYCFDMLGSGTLSLCLVDIVTQLGGSVV